MDSCNPEQLFTLIPGFEEGSKNVAQYIHDQVLKSEEARSVTDIMHGVWLEHPLHPALTDFVIGAWFFGSVLDTISLTQRSRRFSIFRRPTGIERAADALINIGNAIAVPTAMAGLADYSTIPRKAAVTAATHGLMNAGGLMMNVASAAFRCRGERGKGILISALASSALMLSAWLGGRLVYEQKVGVSRIPESDTGKEWKTAIKDSDLQENVPVRVSVEDTPVLLHRSGNEVHAIGAVCAHEGAPLEKGEFHECKVTCPWHQSVYDLHDGHVIHGPSTHSEPAYDTRTIGGNVEIKAAS